MISVRGWAKDKTNDFVLTNIVKNYYIYFLEDL